jgi:hypothetical protein
MSASTQASFTKPEAKTEKAWNSSSQADKLGPSPQVNSPKVSSAVAEAPTVAPPPACRSSPRGTSGAQAREETSKAASASQGIEEEAITAGKLAEYSFPHRGHTLRILNDGRIVRCSKLCTFTSLQEEFGDLIQRYPHLADERPISRT